MAMVNLWLRRARKGWRNDGGPIPYQLRGRVKRHGNKTAVVDNPLQRCRVGHWIVSVGGQLYVLTPQDMRMLYSYGPITKAKKP